MAYHYSGNFTDGAVYWPVIVSIVEAAALVGLHVLNVTTDMGSPNRAMWKSIGVTYDKPRIQHPVVPNQLLHFMPDVPHLVKNLKSAIIRGQIITIPQHVVEKEQLASSKVSVAPLKDLVSFQEGMALMLAPNLSRGVLETCHVEKMKVSSAMHIRAALWYMVEEERRPDFYLTTSWFLEKVDHWMASCRPAMLLLPSVILRWKSMKTKMDVFGLSIPGTPSAASSLLQRPPAAATTNCRIYNI